MKDTCVGLYTHTQMHITNFSSPHLHYDYKQIMGHPKNMVSSTHKALYESSNITSHPMEQSFLSYYGLGTNNNKNNQNELSATMY